MRNFQLLVILFIAFAISCRPTAIPSRQLGEKSAAAGAIQSPKPAQVMGADIKESELVPGKIIFRSQSPTANPAGGPAAKSIDMPDVDPMIRLEKILLKDEKTKLKKSSLFQFTTDTVLRNSSFGPLIKNASSSQIMINTYEMVTIPQLEAPSDSNRMRTMELIAALNKDSPGTAFADFKAYAFLNSNDPFMPPSKGAWNQPFLDLWGLDKLQITQAWDTSEGSGQIVAVIDTGVDSNHEDLLGQVLPGFNAITTNSNQIDDHGHGTHVAGTIAAIANNANGIAGVAPRAKILPIKVLNSQGFGYFSVVASGIKWAADNGATVINLSLGAAIAPENVPPYISDALTHAYAKGVAVIVAAGNSGFNLRSFTPANDPHVLSVAATNSEDKLASFSNFGPRLGVSAPGGGDTVGGDPFTSPYSVLSLKSSGSRIDKTYNVGERYLRLAGTSMAAPHVAGVAALIKSKFPSYSVPQVYQAIRINADDIADAGIDNRTGPGRLNAFKSMVAGAPLSVWITSKMPISSYSGEEFSISGIVGGPNLKSWALEFALDAQSNIIWTTIASGTSAVEGEIAKWTIPTSFLDRGILVRLRAENTLGQVFEVRQDTEAKLKRAFLGFDPYRQNFRDLVVGQTEQRTLMLKNIGPISGTIQTTTFDDPVFSYTGGTFPGRKGTCKTVVEASETCFLEVEFAPTIEKSYQVFMNVNYMDGVSDSRATTIFFGLAHNPRALVGSRSKFVDFSTVDLEQAKVVEVELVNSGELAAQISNWVFTGSAFRFAGGGPYPGKGGTCTATLNAGANCVINLELLAGSAPASFNETLSFDYNAAGGSIATFAFILKGEAANLYPWRNRKNHLDVDNDGFVSPLDVLAITNAINTSGSKKLDNIGPTAEPRYYFDVNGDGSISPLDSLTVINFLNSR